MSLSRKDRRIVTAMMAGVGGIMVLMVHSMWAAHALPPFLAEWGSHIFWVGSTVLAAKLVTDHLRACWKRGKGDLRHGFFLAIAPFFFGAMLMMAGQGLLALLAKIVPGTPVDRCYQVVDHDSWRGHRLDLVDPRTGTVQALRFRRWVLHPTSTPGRGGLRYARVVGTQSVFGANIERIAAAPGCVLDAAASR